MFERYTANALKDILNAEEEAKRTGQSKIGTSHLLIGIIKNRRSMISVVLKDYGITLTRVRKEVKNKSIEEKKVVIEALWNIIYSDKNADMYETNLMRRLSGLLYLDPKIVGDIKQKIKSNQ